MLIKRECYKRATSPGAVTAWLYCPLCGRRMALGARHTVRPDGVITPSVVCPYDCGFHDFVQLEGWEER